VYIAVRADRPMSLAAAFERPVAPGLDGGHGEPARDALASYAGGLHRVWDVHGGSGVVLHGHASIDEEPRKGLGDYRASYGELINAALGAAYLEELAEASA
jgi:CRISPR system Cascade subunit CasC